MGGLAFRLWAVWGAAPPLGGMGSQKARMSESWGVDVWPKAISWSLFTRFSITQRCAWGINSIYLQLLYNLRYRTLDDWNQKGMADINI